MKKIKTGDYVEVLPGAGNTGVEDGEQGLVVDDSNQSSLRLIFPAGNDPFWVENEWRITSGKVKLLYRPRN